MINQNKQTQPQQKTVVPGNQRNYNEVVEFLDARWQLKLNDKELHNIKALDKALGNISKQIPTILVGGTNGKGLTINFAATLLKEEGLKVGALYSPHILTYNERLTINNETISNKAFTEVANEVINVAESNNIKAHSLELLIMMGLLYFKQSGADLAILEITDGTVYEPLAIFSPNIIAITRVVDNNTVVPNPAVMEKTIKEILTIAKKNTYVVSADQSKANLQIMLEETKKHDGVWSMPIRKLAQLSYPFEQLHGRCAALAERICQIYINHVANKNAVVVEHSLLAKQPGKRGRPTLKQKQQDAMNPKKTVDQFWKEITTSLPAHFQVLDKEKPTILLDNASNIDALENLLLGIRLLHYRRPLKGLTFIFGCDKNTINTEEFLRLLRYFSKKNSGNIIFCPINNNITGIKTESWDVEQITNDVKSLKIKAKSAKNFEDAFDQAKKSNVDERYGLIVISGSKSIISEYWHLKGIKKL